MICERSDIAMTKISRRELLHQAGAGVMLVALGDSAGSSARVSAGRAASESSVLIPAGLRCEYLTDPLGIDAVRPRLSWTLAARETAARGLKQAAYRILVASSAAKLQANHPDVWDSGKVKSDGSNQVEYSGKPLHSRTQCWWKVRVWDQTGSPSPWSKPARWSIGLLQASDWSGHWISGSTGSAETEAVYLRRVADLPRLPSRATAYICGLGYYEFYVNSDRVGDHVLDPGFTDYNKRVLYVTYDVTRLMRRGKNVVSVILGNGWYHPVTPDLFGFENAPWREPPKLLVNIDLEYRDGSHQVIASDSSWKWSHGPVTFNCVRGGITYDARLEKPGWNETGYEAAGWLPARETAAPKGQLRAQMQPPIRVTETVSPVKLTEPRANIYVFDLGVNLTGWARFEAHGQPGQKITLKYDLVLNPDGTVNMKYCHSHTYGRFQTDELILDQHGRGVLEPRFTYHGVRYVQVEGLNYTPALSSLTARNAHTDWQPAGEFSCSDPMINRMQRAIQRTLSECAHSMPGEEPTREKMGWTQDGQNTMEAAIYNFQAAPVYTNYLFDMIDAQQSNGSVPPIVPTDGWGDTGPTGAPARFSDPWWGGTLPYVALKLHDYYGDRRALEEAYAPMKRWVAYLSSTAKDDLIDWGIGDWLDLGSTGWPKRTPVVQTSTAGYYYCVMAVVRAARLLGKAGDAAEYEQLARNIKASFNSHFFDSRTGFYAKDSQTAQVLPLWLDMVPVGKKAVVLQRLIENIHQHDDHMTTGFIGVMPMLRGLADWGYQPLAYKIAMQKDMPGFLWMVERGNTTMYESVDNLYGTDLHPFGACIGSFLFREIAGIRPHPLAAGFRKIIIRPVPGNLTWAKAKYEAICGPVSTEWRREAHRFTLRVSIPPNATAVVFLPATSPEAITESGRPVREARHVKLLRVLGNKSIVAIGSGAYDFVVKSHIARPSS
jgi:alpha-L-rhamnosidase